MNPQYYWFTRGSGDEIGGDSRFFDLLLEPRKTKKLLSPQISSPSNLIYTKSHLHPRLHNHIDNRINIFVSDLISKIIKPIKIKARNLYVQLEISDKSQQIIQNIYCIRRCLVFPFYFEKSWSLKISLKNTGMDIKNENFCNKKWEFCNEKWI